MAFTSSGSSSSSDFEVDSCSKTCVKAYATLKEQYDSFSSDYKKSQFNLLSYKAGLGYDAATAASPVVESFVNLTDKSGSDKGYQSVPPPLINNTRAPIIKDWNSDDESEVEPNDRTVIPSTKKIKFVKTVKETDAPKQNKHHPRGNQRNWNNLMSRKLSTADAAVNTVRLVNTANTKAVNTVRSVNTATSKPIGNPQQKEYKEKGVIDSGCSRHMTGNKCYLDEYEDYDGGFVSFGDGKGRISGKGKIKTGSLDFDDVYFCKELKYNLFSVSQICDKKNNVLFTDTECLVLSSNFKLLDESQVLLRVPRKDNIYSVDLKSVVPTGGLTCLIAKATIDESNTWHRRLGHINFKTMNKLVKGNLVKGLPSKIFENDHSCVACQKGKQHKASYKTKLVNSISKPLHMLHMDLFGPTNVKSLMKKSYCLVVTDDFSRFSWDSLAKVFAERRTGTLDRRMQELCQAEKKIEPKQEYILIPLCIVDLLISQDPKDREGNAGKKAIEVDESRVSDNDGKDEQATRSDTAGPSFANAAPSSSINAARTPDSTANAFEEHLFERFSPFKNASTLLHVPNMSPIHDTGIFGNAYDDEDVEEEVDMNNVVSSYTVPDAPFTKFLKDHPKDQFTSLGEQITKTFQIVCLPVSYLKWNPRNQSKLKRQASVKAIQDVASNIARIEAIRLFMAYASFKDFVVYQMDVKSAFLYGKIEEEVYVYQPPGFEDPDFPDKVYKVYVDDIIFGSTKKKLSTEFEKLMHDKFQMSSIGELSFFLGLQVQQKNDIAGLTFAWNYFSRISTLSSDNQSLLLQYSRDGYVIEGELKEYEDSCEKSSVQQTIVANSTTEAEYVVAANCYGQNLVFHSKTKHIEIRHHFIRDSYEKKLIQVIKIHTDQNVADLLTKAFDVSRFNFLNASIGMLNL
ncbi:putative ribonuclease H-like domain-containing protein [Tanacetum coccineum]